MLLQPSAKDSIVLLKTGQTKYFPSYISQILRTLEMYENTENWKKKSHLDVLSNLSEAVRNPECSGQFVSVRRFESNNK